MRLRFLTLRERKCKSYNRIIYKFIDKYDPPLYSI